MSDMSDPYFNDPDGFKPFSPEQPKSTGRGCFFYGCIGVLVVAALGAIALTVVSVVALRFGSRLVEEYTATQPVPVPIVELPAEEVEAIEQRVEAFETAAESGEEETTLRLTAEEINGLIAQNPDIRGRLAVEIEGDELRGKLSFPLEELGLPRVLFGGLQGRYLNGEARFRPILVGEGVMRVQVEELIVKGQPVPQEFLDGLNQGDSTIRFDEADGRKGEFMRRIERIDVEDGAVVLRARAVRDVPEAEPSEAVEEAPAEPDAIPETDLPEPSEPPPTPPEPPTAPDANAPEA